MDKGLPGYNLSRCEKLSKADVKKVLKLNDVLDKLKVDPRPYEKITCLTSLKSLCKNELIYREYCWYLFSLVPEYSVMDSMLPIQLLR